MNKFEPTKLANGTKVLSVKLDDGTTPIYMLVEHWNISYEKSGKVHVSVNGERIDEKKAALFNESKCCEDKCNASMGMLGAFSEPVEPKPGLNERVRYNADRKGRKDVLFTIKKGDTIYFGISRTNRKMGDTYDKTYGVLLAQARANEAMQAIKCPLGAGLWFINPDDKNSGYVAVQGARQLFDYFDGLVRRK